MPVFDPDREAGREEGRREAQARIAELEAENARLREVVKQAKAREEKARTQ